MPSNNTPIRRRRTNAERRRIILEAAARSFGANGYHATSIRDLATASGITQPVLYDHFRSKEEIYVALLESVRDDLTATTAEIMATAGSAEDRIRDAIDKFFQYVEAHPHTARVLFAQPEGEPKVVNAWRRVQAEATDRLVAVLGSERGLVPGIRGRRLRLKIWMEFMKRGLHALAAWWALNPQVSRGTLVNAVMDMLWNGLAASHQHGRPSGLRRRRSQRMAS